MVHAAHPDHRPLDSLSIERLEPPGTAADVGALAALLVDAVDSGAAVSFLAPLTTAQAEAWWRATLGSAPERAIFLVARDHGEIVGTVQVQPAWAPNQPHRGEVVKMLVHRRRQRAGLGTRLMRAVEDEARKAGYALLTLDAKADTPAERLYRRLGWTFVGIIPRYALDTDARTPHAAALFYKDVGRA